MICGSNLKVVIITLCQHFIAYTSINYILVQDQNPKYFIMIVKQIYETDNKSQLTINIPENFRHKRHVLVVIDDAVDSMSDKMDLMKKASKDPLFLADIDLISKDFNNSDSELG